jgi:hypothetical protein
MQVAVVQKFTQGAVTSLGFSLSNQTTKNWFKTAVLPHLGLIKPYWVWP